MDSDEVGRATTTDTGFGGFGGFSGFCSSATSFSIGLGFSGVDFGGTTGRKLGDRCLFGGLSSTLGTLSAGPDTTTSFFGADLVGLRFFGPRARPFVRCVNSLLVECS